MSDESTKVDIGDEPTQESGSTDSSNPPTEEQKIMGMPLGMFMRGGTTSWAHDQELAKHKADVAERRAKQDKDMEIASTPLEQGGGAMFTNYLTENANMDKAYVHLQYLSKNLRNVDFECLGDVTMMEDNELALILICPVCAQKVGLDLAHLTIRQSHKKWELDTRKAGELIIFDGQPYRSAGRIRECQRFRCSQCDWAGKIDDNKVYPD